jgi:hypothetical protein
MPAATSRELAAPAAWLREAVRPEDVLFPFSPLYLAALPESAKATVVSKARPELVLRQLGDARLPARAGFVAVPLEGAALDAQRLRSAAGDRLRLHRFRSWLVLEVSGPFADHASLLAAMHEAVAATHAAAASQPPRVRAYLLRSEKALEAALP